jgi:hypothetical protein
MPVHHHHHQFRSSLPGRDLTGSARPQPERRRACTRRPPLLGHLHAIPLCSSPDLHHSFVQAAPLPPRRPSPDQRSPSRALCHADHHCRAKRKEGGGGGAAEGPAPVATQWREVAGRLGLRGRPESPALERRGARWTGSQAITPINDFMNIHNI